MNILEQPNTQHHEYVDSPLQKGKRIEVLQNEIKQLSKLCDELNPYAEITKRQRSLLKRYNIYDFYDPFAITNKLLVILEDYIEELQKLTPKNNSLS